MPAGGQERFQEIANRGLQDRLPPDQRARFDEALRRNLITLPGPQILDTPSFGETAVGLGEMALTLGTGALAEPLAGVGGIVEGISEFVRGGDPSQAAADRVDAIANALTFQPRSDAGQQIQNLAGRAIEPIVRGTEEFVGEQVIDPNEELGKGPGSPALAAGSVAGLQFIPALFGLRGTGAQLANRRAANQAFEEGAESINLDVDQPVDIQGAQIIEEADRLAGGQTVRGQNLEFISEAVGNAREIARQETSRLYDDARSTQAGININQAREFESLARRSLADFDTETMPIVQRRLQEIADINELPDNSIIQLNAIAQWRQRINRNQPASTDRAQIAALGVLKGQLDEFLDAQFNADMITGNPAAIDKWRVANEAYKEFKDTFDANKVVRQLAENAANPEELRNWILGASSVGAKKEAGDVVSRIKNIVGEDSGAFSAIRQEVLFDIMEPLFREQPSIRSYRNNYNRFVRNNPTLADELFPDSREALDNLSNFSQAIKRSAPDGLDINFDRTISRGLFGHGLARGQLRIGLAENVIRLMRRATGPGDRQRVMENLLGYNPNQTILPLSPVVIGAGVQTLSEEEDGN